MKRTEARLLVFVVLVLIALLILSSTNLVLGEKRSEVYVLSVLVHDDSSENWSNFRMGMDQAAKEWNADISFVTLYDRGSTSQQGDLLQREVENGVAAIILSPTDSVGIKEAVDKIPVNIPVITLGATVDSSKVRGEITAQYFEMGAALGAQISAAHRLSAVSQVVEATYYENRSDIEEISQSLRQALPSYIPVRRVRVGSEEELAVLVAQLREQRTPTTVVALDPSALLTLSEQLESQGQGKLSLYGVGWNSGLLRHLENGVITTLGVCNDYDMGYLSVELAVKQLLGQRIQRHHTVGHQVIPGNQIHSKDYEMLLFPIV